MTNPLESKHVAAIEKQEILIFFLPYIVIIIFCTQKHTHVDCMTLQIIVMIATQQQGTYIFFKLQIIRICKMSCIVSAISFHPQGEGSTK